MNTQQLSPMNTFGNLLSAANTISSITTSTFSLPIAAVLTTGTICYNVYSYFSPKADLPEKSVPDHMILDNNNDNLQPYTKEELRPFPLSTQQGMILCRAQKIRDQEAKKLILKGLLRLQNEAKTDEIEAQKDIDKFTSISRNLASIHGGLVETGQIKIKETPAINEDIDNIHYDHNDDVAQEQMRLELERLPPNPEDHSKLVKSSSSPIIGKRKESKRKTPSTDEDIEPPKKKSKSVELRQICSICSFAEMRLWANKNGKYYCYNCHTSKLNRCSYKPNKGGRACFRTNEGELPLCSRHKHTTIISQIV